LHVVDNAVGTPVATTPVVTTPNASHRPTVVESDQVVRKS
jgi:hypothetical protein